MHEASMHEENCFITLTYNDDNVPPSLNYRHFQLFMKRFRKRYGKDIRFYMCGEYGDDMNTARPHFHACIFGFNFPDRVKVRLLDTRSSIYRSESLSKLWPYGFSSVGDVNFESAAYVARYVTKKVTGDPAESHYQYIIPETGEIIDRVPEFGRMSLKPGIGSAWLDKFASDVYPSDEVIVRGRPCKPPRFYDKRFYADDANIAAFEDVQFCREMEAKLHVLDNEPDRLKVREQVAFARLNVSKRKPL